jgi:NhaA family Na+:H+ antiporter
VIAIVWANLAAESYFRFSQAFGFLVNEVGMAFFFALIAQEIVEAVMPGGALHSWRRWGLPIIAAIGGILGAALTFVGWVHWKHQLVLLQAWPIACAMDIAVAYYVLKFISRRSALLPFVLLLGIATNLFGVIVVALQGPPVETRTAGMALVLAALGLAVLLRAWRVPTFWPYLALCGTISWWAFYLIGVHPALAFLPIVPLLPHEPRKLDLLAAPPDDDATHHFEHEWHNLVQVILFFFGLVNAGVLFNAYYTGTWALLAAALIGRPAGVLAAIALATVVGMHLPSRVRWRELTVMALASSSGFAFALFLAAELIPLGPVRDQITMASLLTVGGAAITFAVARLLRVGRFARRSTAAHPPERPSSSPEREAPWDSV